MVNVWMDVHWLIARGMRNVAMVNVLPSVAYPVDVPKGGAVRVSVVNETVASIWSVDLMSKVVNASVAMGDASYAMLTVYVQPVNYVVMVNAMLTFVQG